MLTQFARLSEMTKIQYKKVQLKQITRFYREGSVLDGSVTGGPVGLETAIEVQSDEPAERIAHLVKLAERSCFALQSMVQNVEVTASATLNGAPLDLGAPTAA